MLSPGWQLFIDGHLVSNRDVSNIYIFNGWHGAIGLVRVGVDNVAAGGDAGRGGAIRGRAALGIIGDANL